MLVDFICRSDRFYLPFVWVKMKTHLPKVNLDERKWHVIDADGAVLGRLAAQVADILRGKKETAKQYMTYSGWKGGEKYTTVERLRVKNPEHLITHAVKGMIPKNRLGRVLLTKLKAF